MGPRIDKMLDRSLDAKEKEIIFLEKALVDIRTELTEPGMSILRLIAEILALLNSCWDLVGLMIFSAVLRIAKRSVRFMNKEVL